MKGAGIPGTEADGENAGVGTATARRHVALRRVGRAGGSVVTLRAVGTRVEHVGGRRRLDAATAVLQRTRRADPTAGIWDAADPQWWWRRPRSTDDLELPVWFDEAGPVAAALLTDWGDRWQLDALVVPGTIDLGVVWSALLGPAARATVPLEVLVREDDADLVGLVADAGFEQTEERSGTTWMDAGDRPAVAAVPSGYRVVDRTVRPEGPHPMAARNGDQVEQRLRQVSLYDPTLDLAVETEEGEIAGYALFWFDAVTGVGMLEPMRVEDAHQRHGLARALLTEGLDRLADKGTERLKVGFDGPAGEHLYLGAGFVVDAMIRSHVRPVSG